jgi:hypothetical protein
MSRCPACEKQARRERREAKANGDLEGATQDRNGRVVQFTEEERKRRSDLAKRLHAEGRFGGPVVGARGGQAIKRHRITDAVLDHFREPDMQELVIKAYVSNLKGKNRPARLRAAESLLQREEKQDERMRSDRGGAVDPAGMTQDQLMEFVEQGLLAMMERGEIPGAITLGDDDVEVIE